MAKQCIYCGHTLPRDDARFCNNCGKTLPSPADKPPGGLENERPSGQPESLKEAPTGDEILPEESHPPMSLTGSPPRELHVKVWGQEENVDDLPTRPLMVNPPQASPVLHAPTPDEFSSDLFPGFDEVEALETRPLLTRLQGKALSPATRAPAEPHKQAFRDQPGPTQVQKSIPPASFHQLRMEPVQRHTPPVPLAASPLARPEYRRKSRRPLVFVLGLLLILLAGGVAAWIMLFHPFTVPPITQTTRSFQNTDLGVSLQYPQGWTAQIDKKNGAVHFYDANQTDQVDIRTAITNGQSIDQYISKQVASLGMTGQKTGTSLSFAGVSWQQVQGSVLQSGASYTAALLVTTHGGRYYAIIQLAPSTTFAQEDHLAFSNIRSSFQFIGNHT